MINKIDGDCLKFVCKKCNEERSITISDIKKVEDSAKLPVCDCGAVSFLNLKADFDELDDDYINDVNMPDREINNRKYIKDLKEIMST